MTLPTGTIAAATPRAAVLKALAACVAATESELVAITGLEPQLVRQLLLAMAVGGRVRRAGMARTDAGLEVIWARGVKR
jgi:hypothetical protein